MEQIIKINTNERGEVNVSARELYDALEVKKRFSAWFETNAKQLIENEDFTSVLSGTEVQNNGGTQLRQLQDYKLTVDAAKQIAMMSGTEKGKQVRMYFIEVEKQWNSPELMLSRSLQYAQSKLVGYENEIAEMTPKVEMHDVYLEKGDPRIVIAEKMVASLKPDLLVMGKTGTNKISRIFLGSTARYVSENAQTNVLLVE